MSHDINRIQSKDHNITSYWINDISLPSYNDKKYLLENGYSRLSNFHKPTCYKKSKKRST